MRKYVLLFAMLFLLTLVVAEPPFTSTESAEKSIIIESAIAAPIVLGHNYSFHVHAINSSDGKLLTNETTWCIIHIYQPITGKHLVEANMSFDENLIDFTYTVLGSNFSTQHNYEMLFYCEVYPAYEEYRGGQVGYEIPATSTGYILTTPKSIIIFSMYAFFLLLFILTFNLIFRTDRFEVFVGGFCLLYIILFIIIYLTWAIFNAYLVEFEAIINILWIIWLILGFGFLPFLFVIGIYIFKKSWAGEEYQRYLTMGYTDKEARTLLKQRKL